MNVCVCFNWVALRLASIGVRIREEDCRQDTQTEAERNCVGNTSKRSANLVEAQTPEDPTRHSSGRGVLVGEILHD